MTAVELCTLHRSSCWSSFEVLCCSFPQLIINQLSTTPFWKQMASINDGGRRRDRYTSKLLSAVHRVTVPPPPSQLVQRFVPPSSSPTPAPQRQTYSEKGIGVVPGRGPVIFPVTPPSTGLSTTTPSAAAASQAQIQEFAALVALSGCGIAVVVAIITLFCCHYCLRVSDRPDIDRLWCQS